MTVETGYRAVRRRMRIRRFPSPREIEKTGDDKPVNSLTHYVLRMSGRRHQAALCLIAIAASLANLAPVELHRRIIDNAITPGDVTLLIWLGGALLGVHVLHQGLKYWLRLYQSWISESAIYYTRGHSLRIHQKETGHTEEDGSAAMVLGSEIDKLGGFVGTGPSNAVADVAMTLGVTVYMFVVEPVIAAVSIGFLVPQILLAPVIQNKLNRLVQRRLALVRKLGDDLGEERSTADAQLKTLPFIYRNRLWFLILKFGMKAVLNLLNALAPTSVLVFGGWMAIQGNTTVGVIVAFISGFERMADPLRQLIAFYRLAAQTGVQHRMVGEWMEGERERKDG